MFLIGFICGVFFTLVLVSGLAWIDAHTTWLKRIWG